MMNSPNDILPLSYASAIKWLGEFFIRPHKINTKQTKGHSSSTSICVCIHFIRVATHTGKTGKYLKILGKKIGT